MEDLPAERRRPAQFRRSRIMNIVLVAAIGRERRHRPRRAIPWRLKSDLRHFRALTLDRPVIMGRRSLSVSIGKPLDRRSNIVITRDVKFSAPGAVAVPTSRRRSSSRAQGRRAARQRRDHGDRRQRRLCRSHAAGRSVWRSPMSMPARKATSFFRRSIRRNGASKSARSARQGRATTAELCGCDLCEALAAAAVIRP